MTVTAPPGTGGDPRRAHRATGLLAAFNSAGVLDAADVHVAARLGRLGPEDDERVVLAAALAVRAVRQGSVCVEPAEAARTVLADGDELVDVADLPWPEPAGWLAACRASVLVADGADAPGGRPLRLVGELLYLERYWQEEELIRRSLAERAALAPPAVDLDRLRAGLAAHFPGADAATQRRAAAVGVLRRVTVLAGGPGTGKTTTVARLLGLLADQPGPPLRVALAAPTGKAAARLQEAVRQEAASWEAGAAAPGASRTEAPDPQRTNPAPTPAPRAATTPGGRTPAGTAPSTTTPSDTAADPTARLRLADAATLHRLLGRRPDGTFRHDSTQRLPFDVVVVDETSMVSLPMMARLLDAVRPAARLVLVGDPDQLASVEAGAVLGDLANAPGEPEPALDAALTALGLQPGVVGGVVELDRVWRFGGTIAAFATAVRAGDADTAVDLLRAGAADLELVAPGGLDAVRADVVAAGRTLADAAHEGRIPDALAALDEHRVLCAHRRGPYGVTRWSADVERWLAPPRAAGPWYPGRPVLVTANDYDTGLFNGDTGVVVTTEAGPRIAFARGGDPYPPGRVGEVLTVHAMTVHRGQGSQFRRITVVLPPPESPLLTRELLYTAVTRARERVRIVGTADAVRAAVSRPVRRASGLRSGRAAGADPA